MSYSYIPPQTQISCTRCSEVFYTPKPFSMTCPDCHQRDVDYTARLDNQTRIFQIDETLMNITIKLSFQNISQDRKDVLERLAAQLEQEKKKLSQ